MLPMWLLIVAALLFAPPMAETPECEAIHALVGGELVEWQGYPQGWNLPTDIDRVAHIEFAIGGLWEYRAQSQRGTRWLFWWLNYDASTDSNGDHYGNHNFCGPYRITDD